MRRVISTTKPVLIGAKLPGSFPPTAMVTLALDTKRTEMRLYCLSGVSHAAIIVALQRGDFAFDNLGAFFVIKGSLDWRRVLIALGLDPTKAVMRGRGAQVIEVKT